MRIPKVERKMEKMKYESFFLSVLLAGLGLVCKMSQVEVVEEGLELGLVN